MNIKPIKSEQDYQMALQRLEAIFDAKPNTEEGDEAEILIILIENFENQHYPIDASDPIEAIKIRMEELDLKQKDLIPVIGAKSRVSEVLNKKKTYRGDDSRLRTSFAYIRLYFGKALYIECLID